MARGNLFLGTARGSLGDITMYRYDGQQVTRVRIRKIKNPRTAAQALQRCAISTASKFYSQVSSICDHSFEGYDGALRNSRRFMKLNTDIMREIALKNIVEWDPIKFTALNYGNFVSRNSTETAINPFIVSEGSLNRVDASYIDAASGASYPVLLSGMSQDELKSMTYNDVCNKLGLQSGDQLTFIMCFAEGTTAYIKNTLIGRLILAPSDGDMSKPFLEGDSINDPNKENRGPISLTRLNYNQEENKWALNIFNTEGNNTNLLTSNRSCAFAVIASRYENKQWKRSTQYMIVNEIDENKETLQAAIDSYIEQETSSMYLNQANDGELPPPSPAKEINEQEYEVETTKSKKAKSKE